MRRASGRPGAAVVTVLLAIALVGCGGGPDGPDAADGSSAEGVVVTFYDLLNDGDLDSAIALYSPEAIATIGDPRLGEDDSAFAEWVETETRGGTVEDVEIVRAEADPSDEDRTTVLMDVVYADGTTVRRSVQLVRIEGAWKMGLIG